MKILYDLTTPVHCDKTVSLTIGNFDGFHRGHQFVIDALNQSKKQNKGFSAVITFENHPSTILRPEHIIPQITTAHQKIDLLTQAGIDFLFLLKFTQEFSQQTPEVFLAKIETILPFQTLILGHDAAIGKDREGTQFRIQAYAKEHSFETIFLPAYNLDGTVISSTLIRQAIQKGEFLEVQKLLGRPYSIQGNVVRGQGKGKVIGFPTANLEVKELCLPPQGVYAVHVKYNNRLYEAIANLGIAPTIRTEPTLLLEIHLLQEQFDLYDQNIEVFFKGYIRPERRFDSIEKLSQQIQTDLREALRIFKSVPSSS